MPNSEAAKRSKDKGSERRESAFLNVRDLPDNKTMYFRALPPKPAQREAWGDAPTVPQRGWMLDTGRTENKYLFSISEMSLHPDNTDSVTDYLTKNGLHTLKGFKDETDKVAQEVAAWRNCLPNKFSTVKFRALTPNRSNEYCLTVVPVAKDWDSEGRSVPIGKPVILVLNYKLNDRFNSEVDGEEIGFDPDCWDTGPGGFDFTVAKVVGATTTYTMGIRKAKDKKSGVFVSELLDAEELYNEAPDLMAELAAGVKPEKIITFLSDLLDFEPPAKPKKAKAQQEESDEEDEDPEEVEEEEEEEAPVTRPTRRTSVKLND